MSTTDKLSSDQRMEYQEIGEFVRHDDTVDLAVASVLLPVLAAALGLAWQHHDLAIPLGLGSAAAWSYWWVVKKRRTDFTGLRLAVARDIEDTAGLRQHTAIDRADHEGSLTRFPRIKRIERLLSWALFGAWVWLISAPRTPGWQTLLIVAGALITEVALLTAWRASLNARIAKVLTRRRGAAAP